MAGPSWALTVNAATFALSAVLIAMIRTTTRASDEPAERHWSDLHGIAEHVGTAARVYRDDRLLLTSLVLLVLASMPIMAAEGLVVLYAQAYAGEGAERAGLLSAVIAAGALAAMFVLPHTGSHARLLRVSASVVVGNLVVAGLLLALAPSFLAGVLPLVLLGALASLTVSIGTILGSRLPHASRATAFSLAQGALMSVQGGGALLAGALAERTTVATSVALVSVPGALWGVWALLRARSLDDGAGTRCSAGRRTRARGSHREGTGREGTGREGTGRAGTGRGAADRADAVPPRGGRRRRAGTHRRVRTRLTQGAGHASVPV